MSARTRSRKVASQRPHSTRTACPTRNRVSYQEPSTDDSDIASADGSYTEVSRPKTRQAPSLHTPGQQSTSHSSGKRKARTIRRSKYTLGAKRVKASNGNPTVEQEDGVLGLAGRVPPWQSLPYHILLQIFLHASHPLWTDHFEPTPNIAWLTKTALLCRAFAEPALSALYWSPPLCPPTRTYGLISHLASQTQSSSFNYRAKVKKLEMDARILAVKHRGGHSIDLAELVTYTPQLRGISIHMLTDTPSTRNSLSSGIVARQFYHESTINALERSNVSLLEWKWNWYIVGRASSMYKLKDFHSRLPFQSLRELTLVNYQSNKVWKRDLDRGSGLTQQTAAPVIYRSMEEQVADALECLPNLKRLRFLTCAIVNQKLLCRLPRHLELLEIIDCSSITSDVLSDFLKTHGQDIRELFLDHNQALNLSFLMDFALNCPKLETLKMNLTYHNSHSCFRNSDPKFAALLLQGEVPTWPATLQCVELLHLRKWDIETAELFFSSLVDSAAALPNLRHLNIKASLDESGWRDRVAFRDRWVGRLEKVYLRSSPPPNPHLKSIDTFKSYMAQLERSNGVPISLDDFTGPGTHRTSSSRFSHVEVSEAKADIENESEGDGDAPLVVSRTVTRRSARLGKFTPAISETTDNPSLSKSISRHRSHRRTRNSDSDSSSQDSALEDDSLELDAQVTSQLDEKELYIQGMCDIVHVIVDNLRPTEEQLNESNFLDEEASGDEDWVGDDNMPDDAGCAW